MNSYKLIIVLLIFFVKFSFSQSNSLKFITQNDIKTGAERTEVYFPLIEGKKIAVVANHTSMISNTHLVDSLVKSGFEIKKVFSPEHGFRGKSEAGAKINNQIDKKTGLPIISLYGKHKKPTKDDLKDIDIVVFDIQDVGARFYTYISTMTFVMQACAENNLPLIILDRPNPNGFYVDGPVLEKDYSSFVGLHTIPIVHGMTIAEYADMINSEGWLENNAKCELKIVKLDGYDHSMIYKLPFKPSPNLPNWESVYLYPSLCLFEGTVVSIGRGTDFPFQVYGHPELLLQNFSFTPESKSGESINPKLKGKKCYGENLKDYANNYKKNPTNINLSWIIDSFNSLNKENDFFTNYFDKLAGNSKLRKQIIDGKTEKEIRNSWKQDLKKFKKIRKKYLLYPDF